MVANKKITGRATSLPAGLAIGAVCSLAATLILTAILAKLVEADSFIRQFPKGYDTYVGELGTSLSGGQKQRVALARALVNRPNIIIADEPTAALDKATADEIMEVMKSLNSIGKTIVIVTHDRTVAEKCRRIVELSDGEIISDKTIA